MLKLANKHRHEGTALAGELEPDHSGLLMAVAQSRSRPAFIALFNHFAPRIKSMMIRSGADPALAEDLAQEAMLTVWHKAKLFDPQRGSAAAWIFTIARNLRIDRLRGQSAQPHRDIDDMEIASDEKDGENLAHEKGLSALIRLAIARLPDAQREVVHLSFIEDLAHGRIAKRLGVPVGTVKSRLRLAYDRLRLELEKVQ